jgi:hypothetical protein
MSNRIIVTTSSSPLRLAPAAAKAYAAGLFDGGGCVSIVRQKNSESRHGYVYRLVTSITQNNLKSLMDFQSLAGVEGRIYQIPRRGSANCDSYSLKYDGKAAAELLQHLRPFLLRKLDEANVALLFQRSTHLQRRFGKNGCPEEIWQLRTTLYRKLQSLK